MNTGWIRKGNLRNVDAFRWSGPSDPEPTTTGALIVHRDRDAQRYEPVPYTWLPFIQDVLDTTWEMQYIHRYAFDAAIASWPTDGWGDQAAEALKQIVSELDPTDAFLYPSVSRLWGVGTSARVSRGRLQPSIMAHRAEIAARCLYYLRHRPTLDTAEPRPSFDTHLTRCQNAVNTVFDESDVMQAEIREAYHEFTSYPALLRRGIIEQTIEGGVAVLPDSQQVEFTKLG